MAKKKEKLNIVYSTNPDFQYQYDEEESIDTLPNGQQKLYVSIDRKQRAGKEVTLVEGFIGSEDDLKEDEVLVSEAPNSFVLWEGWIEKLELEIGRAHV
jgi:translation initiation factor 1 (eIF-1/SUI1)